MNWNRFVVCDEDGNISWNSKTEKPESFTKFRGRGGAEARAKEIAETAPGYPIRIYELTAETIVPLKPAKTDRKRPAEHYK
jgi:hypothetical protein